MSKKISQLQLPDIITGQELIPVTIDGNNYAIKVSDITNLVTKHSVKLGNVDNTSDINKPISSATQSALNDKVNVPDFNNLANTVAGKANSVHNHTVNDVIGLEDALTSMNSSIQGLNGYAVQVNDNLQALTIKVNNIVIPTSFPMSAVTGLQATITGINNAIAGKANFVHNHTVEDISGLDAKIQSVASQSGFIQFGLSEW